MTETTKRNAALREMLIARKRDLQNDVQGRVRSRQTDRRPEGRDELEHSEADTQADIALALMQMRTETVSRIDAALERLDTGKYGSCAECERDIAERRLRALPFAVRCQTCENRREELVGAARQSDQRRPGIFSLSDLVRS